MKLLGLIGYPLSHSFSKKYFTDKFTQESIQGWRYELFPLERIEQLPQLLQKYPELVGLNVTIPYKEKVLPYLHSLDASAREIGAVNCIGIQNEILKGYNTDVIGFEAALLDFLSPYRQELSSLHALVLGTGGAAKGVAYVLRKLNIDFQYVSRSKGLLYEALDEKIIAQHPLIINTTPVGMSPHIKDCPTIPYHFLNEQHFLYDLVYNPTDTLFMQKGRQQGAKVENGLTMLYGQAEAAWAIWQSTLMER